MLKAGKIQRQTFSFWRLCCRLVRILVSR